LAADGGLAGVDVADKNKVDMLAGVQGLEVLCLRDCRGFGGLLSLCVRDL